MRFFIQTGILSVVLFVSGTALADRTITVESSGQVGLVPNRVVVQLELWSKDKTAQATQARLSDTQGKVRQVIAKYKIKSHSVQSQNFNLSLEYEYDQKNRRNILVGYSAVENLSVVLENVKEMGPLVDALVGIKAQGMKGVNVQNLKWDSSEREKAETEAAALAVKNAKLQAENIAKAAGVTIKNISKINYGLNNQTGVPEMRVFAMKASMDSAPPTEFSEGQIQVKSTVTVEFEIK